MSRTSDQRSLRQNLPVPTLHYCPPSGFEDREQLQADFSTKERCGPCAKPRFLDLVDLDLVDTSRQWLKPPPPTEASSAAAIEAKEVARTAAAAREASKDANVASVEKQSQNRCLAEAVEPTSMVESAARTSSVLVYPDGWKEYKTPQGRKVRCHVMSFHAHACWHYDLRRQKNGKTFQQVLLLLTACLHTTLPRQILNCAVLSPRCSEDHTVGCARGMAIRIR